MINVSKRLQEALGRASVPASEGTTLEKAQADLRTIPSSYSPEGRELIAQLADSWVKSADCLSTPLRRANISATTELLQEISSMVYDAHAVADGLRSPESTATQMVDTAAKLLRIWSTLHYGLDPVQQSEVEDIRVAREEAAWATSGR